MSGELRDDFSTFYHDHFGAVVRAVSLASSASGSPHDANDITQEAFARTWAHWPSVSKSERPVLYTLKVARNLSNRALRRVISARRIRFDVTHNEVDRPLERTEVRLMVAQALRELPDRQRWALVLCDLLDLSSQEAGRIMRVSPSTVRVQLSRARQRLRLLLSDLTPPSSERS